jgi:hypothetical protein
LVEQYLCLYALKRHLKYGEQDNISNDVLERTNKDIAQPIARALKEEGYNYFGLLYIGAILTKEGPKVIEFSLELRFVPSSHFLDDLTILALLDHQIVH